MPKPRFQIDTTRPEPIEEPRSRGDERRAVRVREEALERLAEELVELKQRLAKLEAKRAEQAPKKNPRATRGKQRKAAAARRAR